MKYVSTRDISKEKTKYSSAQAIKLGLASDGGLFVPDSIPSVSLEYISMLVPLSYPERAKKVLELFLTEYSDEELE